MSGATSGPRRGLQLQQVEASYLYEATAPEVSSPYTRPPDTAVTGTPSTADLMRLPVVARNTFPAQYTTPTATTGWQGAPTPIVHIDVPFDRRVAHSAVPAQLV